jgi:hypothetical protein
VPLCLASFCLYSRWCPKKDKHPHGVAAWSGGCPLFRPSRAPVRTRLRGHEVAASRPRYSPASHTGPFPSRASAYTLLLARLWRHPKTILSSSQSNTPEILQLHVLTIPHSYSNSKSNKHRRFSVPSLSTVGSTLQTLQYQSLLSAT